METTSQVLNNCTVVSPQGKLDAMSCGALEQELSDLIGQGVRKLILDFSDLSYISSAGLRILLKTAKLMQSAGGGFVLCGMKDFIREVFDVSGFSGIISTVDNCEKAIAKLEE